MPADVYEMTPLPLSPELQVLLYLSRTRLSETDRQDVFDLFSRGIRPEVLTRLSIGHGLAPLAYSHLKGLLPNAEVVKHLQPVAHTQIRRTGFIRSSLISLLELFEQKHIEVVPFKGPVLDSVAYGGKALRPCTDIDLLIHREDVSRTIQILSGARFQAVNRAPYHYRTHWRTYFPFQHPHGNANGYIRDRGTQAELSVDLHWGLASRYFLLPLDPEPLWSRLTPVRLDGTSCVNSFSPEDTILLTCIHAVKHRMERLLYVADVAQLIHSCTRTDWGGLLEMARSCRCERMLLLGIRLARDLLRAPVPQFIEASMRETHGLDRVAGLATTMLLDPTRGIRRTGRTLQFDLLSRDRVRDAWGSILHELQLTLQPTSEDRSWIRLPKGATPLYRLVRPIRILTEALSGPGKRKAK